MIFISYARENTDLAEKVALALRAGGYEYWIDREKIQYGDRWSEAIEIALKTATRMIVIVTSASVDQNSFVRREVGYIRSIRRGLVRILAVIAEPLPEEQIPFDISDLQQIRCENDINSGISQLLTTLDQADDVPKLDPQSECEIEVSQQLLVDKKITDEDLEILRGFRQIQHIYIKDSITRGHSGSKVFWVDAKPRKPNAQATPHFLKIHNALSGDQARQRHESVYNKTKLRNYMPKLVDYTLHAEPKQRIALLYSFSGTKPYKSLDNLLHQNFSQAVNLIRQTCDALVEWNEEAVYKSGSLLTLPDLLKRALSHSEDPDVEKRRIGDATDSIQARLKEMCHLNPQATMIVFGGDDRNLPNPLAYLMNHSLWQSVQYKSIQWPCGHIHGDLNVRNILETSERKRSTLSLIDFDTYDPQNLIFVDFAYLEIAIILQIIMRFCNPENPENHQELLEFSRYLALDIPLSADIPLSLGFISFGLNMLLLPLRQTVSNLCTHFDYEVAFWVARMAAGLEMARKARALRPERILALLIAADSLNRLLKELNLRPKEGPISYIDWISPQMETQNQ